MKCVLSQVTIFVLIFTSYFVLASDALKVSFKDRVVLRSETLRMSDVIESKETDIDFVRRYGEIKISDDKSSDEKISRSHLYSLLHQAGANLENLQIRMGQGISVERGQLIQVDSQTSNKLINVLSSEYNIPKNDIEVVKTRIFPRLSESSLSSAYFRTVKKIDLSRPHNAKYMVQVEDIDGVASSHTLFVSFEIETPVLMAKEGLEEGATLNTEHFILGRQKIKSLRGKLMPQKDFKNYTFKYKKGIKKDEVLLLDMVRQSVLVNEGSLVTISYKTPYLTISTIGKLHDTGEIGQVVRVENIDSNRIVKGRLISPDLVEVASE